MDIMDIAIAKALSGGGGGGGGASVFIVNYDISTDPVTADKTYDEIEQAILSGQNVVARHYDGSVYLYAQLVEFGQHTEETMGTIGFQCTIWNEFTMIEHIYQNVGGESIDVIQGTYAVDN